MKTVKLSDVCEFKRGLTYKKTDEVSRSHNVVLRANNIDLASFKLNFNELKYISDDIDVPDSKYVKKNTILICTASGSKSHLGKVALVDEDYGYAFGGFMGLIVPDHGRIDASYLYKVLTSKQFRELIDSLTDGANINNLKFSLIEGFEFALPSLEEQQRIVARLDAAFERISAAEVLMKRNLDNVSALQKSILHKYLSADDSTHTHRLGDLTRITIGRTPSRGNPLFWDKNKLTDNVWLSIADLMNVTNKSVSDSKEYITDEAAKAFTIVPKGTLLVSFKLTLGRTAFAGRGLRTNEAIAAIHNHQESIMDDYLYYFFNQFDWANYAASDRKVKGLTLNKAKLSNIIVTYPKSLESQAKIVRVLNTELKKLNILEAQYTKKLAKLNDLRQSLLAEAFMTTSRV